MITLEQQKQLDDLVIAEVNIKNFARLVQQTDEGDLVLNYDGTTREYDLLFNGNVLPRKKLYDEVIKKLLI